MDATATMKWRYALPRKNWKRRKHEITACTPSQLLIAVLECQFEIESPHAENRHLPRAAKKGGQIQAWENLDMMGNEEHKPRQSLSSNIVSATGAT